MPISGQSSLTNIAAAQSLVVAYQPLLLAQFLFTDGTPLNLSTENLDSAYAGVQYLGVNYLPRIRNQSIETLQAVSANGIVQSPAITLDLADADKALWNNFEFSHGFKGAKMTLLLIFWDPGTSTFSSDSRVMFVGICNPASASPTALSITATSLLNMTRTFLPTVAISQLCPWTFPATKADRIAAAVNADSIFYQCGYSVDVSDSDIAGGTAAAVGNLSSGSPFTVCGKGWSDCIARLGNSALATSSTNGNATHLQILYDTTGRNTGRFGGIRFSPQSAWSGRAYLSGTKVAGINNPQLQKYSEYFPMLYGKAMVTAPVMNIAGDPNSTRFEAVVCVGQIHTDLTTQGPIQAVLVNGILIPFYQSGGDPLNAWFWTANGSRNGSVTYQNEYNGRGDPYGSLACILVVVYASVADSNSTPTVQVLTAGPHLRTYPSGTLGSETTVFTDNPAWCVADMLTWGNFSTADLDLASFEAAAAYCATTISYVGLNGSGTHPRYRMGLALQQRRSLADILKTVLAGFNAILRPSLIDGTLQLVIKQSFPVQQPSAVAGSNNSSAIAGGGYSAYDFAESSIKLTDGGGFEDTRRVPTLGFSQRSISDTPNRLTLTYQDEDYSYNTDTLIEIDSADISRAGGQMIAGNVAAEGIVNYDQAVRVIQAQLAQTYRGNNRGDSGGTYTAEWETTFRALHLRCGDLIRLSFASYGLSAQPFRVMSIQPSMNYESARLTADWHNDAWYADSYGQAPAPTPAGQGGTPARPPYSWCPNLVAPASGDALYTATALTFGLAQAYAATAGGNVTCALNVSGKLPANLISNIVPPLLPVASATSGSIPAGTYFFTAAAIDAQGYETSLNLPPWANVTLTGAGGAALSGFIWSVGTASYKIFGGSDLFRMSLQASGSGTPGSLTISALNVATEGAPDKVADHLQANATKVWQPGCFAAACSALTSTTVAFSAAAFTTNQFAGSILTLLGSANNSANIPVVNATIASNTATVITISGLDLIAAGCNPKDVFSIQARGSTVTTNSIADANLNCSMYTPEPPVAVQSISNPPVTSTQTSGGPVVSSSPVVITSKTPHGYATNDLVALSLFYGAPKVLNGTTATVTVVDSLNFSLNSSLGVGLYAGGGATQRLNLGMRTNAQAGRVLRIIAGTGMGQSYPIASNTQTAVLIVGTWNTTPDSTSLWMVLDAAPTATAQTAAIHNSDPTQTGTCVIPLADVTPCSYFVQVFTANVTGQTALPNDSPFRLLYVFGPPQALDTGLEGVPISTTPPADGQPLVYNATTNQWAASGSSPNFADGETPSGGQTGTNPTYTLAHTPNPPADLELYFNGILQRQGALTDGADYSLAGNTITYWRSVFLPNASEGDDLLAWYRY